MSNSGGGRPVARKRCRMDIQEDTTCKKQRVGGGEQTMEETIKQLIARINQSDLMLREMMVRISELETCVKKRLDVPSYIS
jgi:hypothetical protein